MSNVTPLQGKVPESKPVLDQLTTYDVSQLWTATGPGLRYNPDDLVGRKGLLIYSQMLTDDQLKSSTEFKLAAIMARGCEFVFDDQSALAADEQKARINVFNQITARMKGSLEDAIENVATAREYGFSVTEKVLSQVDIDGKSFTGINKLVLRDPASFQFVADPYGELVRIEQKVGPRPLVVDPSVVIHHVHRPKWDQFYGRSELRAAYRWWYVKEQVVKMWPMYLEKFGAGFGVATRKDSSAPAPNSKEGQSLTEALANIRALTSIYLPLGVEFDLKFPAQGDVYEKCITFCDLAMARSQLVPNLLGFSHTGHTGAYSQSQTQFEAFLWTTQSDGTALANAFNEQLWKPLGDANWGDGYYPCMRFKPASFEHLKWMLETWQGLLTSKSVIASEEDERYLRKLLEMPERQPDEVLRNPVEEEQQQQQHQQQLDLQQAALQQTQQKAAQLERELDEVKRTIVQLAVPHAAVTVHTTGSSTAEPSAYLANPLPRVPGPVVVPHEALRAVPRAVFDRAAERVYFGVIEKRTEALATAHVDQFAQLLARSVKRALGADDNVSALLQDDPADIAAFDLASADRGKLRKTAKDLLDNAWQVGLAMAQNEIDRARRQDTLNLAATRQRFASLRDNAAAFFDAKSFRMAGDASDQVRKLIQNALANGVKYGQPVAEVRTTIWDALVSKGYTTRDAVRGVETDEDVNHALDELWVDSEIGAAAYLNTLVRTNTFEALNEARFAEFTDPALGDFVLALRYAAVLDSSTTEICQALDDSVYAADSPTWDRFRPPNHYNCRSVLVPITAVDGWDGVESDQPSVEPQEGFK